MEILSVETATAWADQLQMLWLERHEKRVAPPYGCYRRRTDPKSYWTARLLRDTGATRCTTCQAWKEPDAYYIRNVRTGSRYRKCIECWRADGARRRRKA